MVGREFSHAAKLVRSSVRNVMYKQQFFTFREILHKERREIIIARSCLDWEMCCGGLSSSTSCANSQKMYVLYALGARQIKIEHLAQMPSLDAVWPVVSVHRKINISLDFEAAWPAHESEKKFWSEVFIGNIISISIKSFLIILIDGMKESHLHCVECEGKWNANTHKKSIGK